MAVAILFFSFIGFTFVVWLLSYVRRRRRRPRPVEPTRCRCGYRMDQLDTVRCPECGRVMGFDATAEELELTDDELRRARQRRDARLAAAAADAAADAGRLA